MMRAADNISTEFSYEIDSLNLISTQWNVNRSYSDGTIQVFSAENSPSTIIQRYNQNDKGRRVNTGYDAAVNYQKGFKADKNRLLTFSYRYYTYSANDVHHLTTSNQISYDNPDYQQITDPGSTEQTFQVDYVHPVKKVNIEGGIKGILRNNNSNNRYLSYDAPSNDFVLDPAKSNAFDNDQNVFGIYNTYSYNLKNWGFKGGIRVEQTIIHADFISSASRVDQDYFNVIPTIAINRKFKNLSSMNFGFTQRIQRPTVNILNPFVDRSNPSFYSTGNPGLRPVLANNFIVNYSRFKKGSMNLGINYSFANNNIQGITVFDSVSKITTTTYQNIGKSRSLGNINSFSYPATKKFSLNLTTYANYIWTQGMVNGVFTKNNGIMISGYGGGSYRFDNGLRLNGNYTYQSRGISLQGRSASYQSSSFSLSKDLIKEKLTFSFSTSNPFKKYRDFRNETSGVNFQQISTNRNYFRAYSGSLNYRFGKLKTAIKKNRRGINNDDVATGN